MIHHIFQMPEAQNGMGIVGHNSKVTKKLGKDKAIFTGTFEECLAQKTKFINNPKLVDAILEEREKAEQRKINSLIKKHR